MFYFIKKLPDESQIKLCIYPTAQKDPADLRYFMPSDAGIFLEMGEGEPLLKVGVIVNSKKPGRPPFLFDYTDHHFKTRIMYQEETGSSLLDNSSWIKDDAGNNRTFRYCNAKIPLFDTTSLCLSSYPQTLYPSGRSPTVAYQPVAEKPDQPPAKLTS